MFHDVQRLREQRLGYVCCGPGFLQFRHPKGGDVNTEKMLKEIERLNDENERLKAAIARPENDPFIHYYYEKVRANLKEIRAMEEVLSNPEQRRYA